MNGLIGKSVRLDSCHLHVELEDGRIIATPMQWFPELQKASLQQLNNYQFICQGSGIEWPELDYHLNIESMMIVTSRSKVA